MGRRVANMIKIGDQKSEEVDTNRDERHRPAHMSAFELFSVRDLSESGGLVTSDRQQGLISGKLS
jgi:hypothetical protein